MSTEELETPLLATLSPGCCWGPLGAPPQGGHFRVKDLTLNSTGISPEQCVPVPSAWICGQDESLLQLSNPTKGAEAQLRSTQLR